MNPADRLTHLEVGEWEVVEPELALEDVGHAESVFALSNGFVGLRGTLDEGEPAVSSGAYVAGLYERFRLPHAEPGYGYPDFGQAMIHAPDGSVIRLIVDDSPFDVRLGTLHAHRRVLSLREGTLTRDVDWSTPRGRRVRISSTRLASYEYRSVSAIRYTVAAVDQQVRIILQSELIANEPMAPAEGSSKDPRVTHVLAQALRPVAQERSTSGALLVHRTKRSGLTVAASIAHEIASSADAEMFVETRPDWARTSFVAELLPGESLTITKYVAHATSTTRAVPLLRSQVSAAVSSARHDRWEGLVARQAEHLDAFWDTADVHVTGRPRLTGMLRYALFQVYQGALRNEGAPIGAKALTGSGYSGHTFWDTEGFLAPVLAAVLPDACADVLRWRASTIDLAKDRAAELGLQGAAFPWRTIDGTEASAYWPASTAAMHINADIVRAFELYRWVTGDESLELDGGLPVIVETARAWISLSHEGRSGKVHLDGLTGPDEYTAVIDDNVFTNLMARRALLSAAERTGRHPDLAAQLGVTDAERAHWAAIAENMFIPYDAELGVHPACAGFTRFDEWDWERFKDKHPIQNYSPYFEIYRHQVIKQADLVQAMWWCPEEFAPDQVARNLDYYERRTSRDSSLSATPQSVVCAQAGHLDLALAYLYEAAAVDLEDVHGNADHGLHMASLAGSWLAFSCGLGGYREAPDRLVLWPQRPDGVEGFGFRLLWRGARVTVAVEADTVTVRQEGDAPLPLRLYGEEIDLGQEPVARPLRRVEPLLPEPEQPVGRAPARLS
ncbi:glycoside hydrolase family 65 protein [Propionicicella superfundia]|uniref:glycoside hydrolase family 65 protein n=1 Tax=Propionicicella superfundia TaxID=348582 RepID=UPI0003FB86C1|nr:glycosyl hydrolase family 65 protein [Propionicicella superfundia]